MANLCWPTGQPIGPWSTADRTGKAAAAANPSLALPATLTGGPLQDLARRLIQFSFVLLDGATA